MSRSFLAVLGLTVLLLAPDAEAISFPIDAAPLRVPQRPVIGNTLQQRLEGFQEYSLVTEAQIDGELFTISPGATYTFQVQLFQPANGIESGLYNGHDANPTLMRLFPGDAHAFSFAVVSYRTSPVRAVVNHFDENAAFLGTTTWLGADRGAIGIYAKGPLGIVYSQDSRNPGGDATWLFLAGTGWNAEGCWLAGETSPLTAQGGAYDDVLWFWENLHDTVTPVARTSWGQLKSRFW